MNEYYPTLLEMAPWNKKYPVTWFDGWNVFRWPQVWTLAPDGYVVVRSNEPKVLLSSLFASSGSEDGSGKKLFVLLFDGINHADTTGVAKALVDDLEKTYPDLLDCFVITRHYDTASYDPVANVLGDIDMSLERAFGATGQCIYVLDHNKKIVWKSCGFMKEKLQNYLQSFDKLV